jgi:hypothetical protein
MLALVVALLAIEAGWAAETDVENPALRELPIQHGPIYGGKHHQPTQTDINERLQAKDRKATDRRPQAEELYQRVLNQSQKGTPRSLEPAQ